VAFPPWPLFYLEKLEKGFPKTQRRKKPSKTSRVSKIASKKTYLSKNPKNLKPKTFFPKYPKKPKNTFENLPHHSQKNLEIPLKTLEYLQKRSSRTPKYLQIPPKT